VPGEQHALELEILARRPPALRPSPVPTLVACHCSHIVLQTPARETGEPRRQRLPVCGGGIFSAVIDLLLLSSFTSLHDLLHSTGFLVARDVLVALAVVFWLGLAYWVNRDARRRTGDPFRVFLATLVGLLPPYIGPVVYLLFRPSETLYDIRSRRVELQALEQQLARSQPACPVCSSSVEPDYVACPVCTTMLRYPCAACKAPLDPLWQMCPYCATPIGPSPVDLDAALTAEAKTISLVEDMIPLVPPAEPRAADA
jgi:Double zinc ribbon